MERIGIFDRCLIAFHNQLVVAKKDELSAHKAIAGIALSVNCPEGITSNWVRTMTTGGLLNVDVGKLSITKAGYEQLTTLKVKHDK